MIKKIFISLLAAAPFAAASVAQAYEVPVKFDVDKKPFKTAAAPGTPLNFDLYSDPNCTELLTTKVATIGAPDLLIERVVGQRLSSTPAPKIVRLRTTIPTEEIAAEMYVRATGASLTPYGGDFCQAQEIAGTEGIQGPQGPPGEVHLIDADGGVVTVEGPPGAPGQDGQDGIDGQDGQDGAAGFGQCRHVRGEEVLMDANNAQGIASAEARCEVGEVAISVQCHGSLNAFTAAYPNAWGLFNDGNGNLSNGGSCLFTYPLDFTTGFTQAVSADVVCCPE